MPLEQMARKTKDFGYDGIELACWGERTPLTVPSARGKARARGHSAVVVANLLSRQAV